MCLKKVSRYGMTKDRWRRPCRALTVRKSVRPLPSHRLALRYTSHHLDRFTSGSSSDHSSAYHFLADHTSEPGSDPGICNRLPTKILKMKTSLETLSEYTTIPQSLTLQPKVFGCTVFSHIPKSYRDKLDPCAEKCVFIGYGEEEQGDPLSWLSYTSAGHGVLFRSNGHLNIQMYTDADWAGDKGNRRSTSGYFSLVGGNLVTWRSKKQKVVSLSSTEAEFRGIAKGLTEALNVIAAEPTRLQDVVRIANNLMDQKLKGYAVRNDENKKRLDNNQRNNRGQQPPVKRQNVGGQNVARAYTTGNNERRGYAGPFPYCNKCKLHHEGQCTVRCSNCKKVRHMARDCKAVVVTTTRGAIKLNHKVVTCYECGRQGHYRSDYPKLKNQNRTNKTGNKTNEARGKAYVQGGGGEVNHDSNVVTSTFLLNNH
nr:putative reverse transcriptase, RNA-dependent DNA polymerase [Tanacetum cinerariifolium]